MKQKVSILGVGIATMDIYCHTGKMYPGGNEYNIAYNAKMLGAEAGFMGVFADDKVGEILENVLVEAGVDISHSRHEKGSSGYALIEIRDGDRVFLDWNKKGVTDLYPFTFSDEELEYMRRFDVVCISRGARITPENVVKAEKAGVRVCYDFYDDFTEGSIEQLCSHITYAFFSCSHLDKERTKEVLKKAVRQGAKVAVGTRGSETALAYDGIKFYEQEVSKTKVKDTMGAGDSYICAFLLNYLSEMKADEPHIADDKIQCSLSEASKFAAEVVAKDGSLGIGFDVNLKELSNLINI